MNKIFITIIWFIFTIIFICLAIYHYSASKRKIAPFPERWGYAVEMVNGEVIKTPFMIFVDAFSEYLKEYNDTNSEQNRRTGFGYLAAAATAFFSMIITLANSVKVVRRKINKTDKSIAERMKKD